MGEENETSPLQTVIKRIQTAKTAYCFAFFVVFGQMSERKSVSPSPAKMTDRTPKQELPQGSDELLKILTSRPAIFILIITCIASVLISAYLYKHGGKYGILIFAAFLFAAMFLARHLIGNYKPKNK